MNQQNIFSCELYFESVKYHKPLFPSALYLDDTLYTRRSALYFELTTFTDKSALYLESEENTIWASICSHSNPVSKK